MLSQAADASGRAVMADTDEASIRYAADAVKAKQSVRDGIAPLDALLKGLGSDDDTRQLDEFKKKLAEYDALDTKVLELAVENTNLKAQRLSFGPVADAANGFRDALQAVAKSAPAGGDCAVSTLVANAQLAVRDVQLLHGPHIAESDDTKMTLMEKDMDEKLAAAAGALATLTSTAGEASKKELEAASAQFERFKTAHAQLIALSRKNTNVRSFMLSLGEERPLWSASDAALIALSESLKKQLPAATR